MFNIVVRFGSFADIEVCIINVCFALKSRHSPSRFLCPLRAMPGDTLVVTRLDRLARSTADLLIIIKATAAKDASFLSLAEPWANTSTAIGKLMLTVLSGVAEFELNLIALRTNEGRVRARQSGVKFGPKFKLSAHQMEEIRKRKEAGESCRFLARSYGVSPNTISRIKAF
jgi:DNA invertase Pin-like site-specific DNA recombinase